MGHSFPLLLFLCFAALLYGGEELSALYLSWYDDPTTTMTIQWHTPLEDQSDEIFLETPDGSSHSYRGTHTPFPNEPLLIHTVHLKNLTPDAQYRFRIGGHPEIHSFQTAPATLDTPLRFVIGGDLYHSKRLFRKMSQTVARLNPLFVVLGGDIAYAISKHPLIFTNPSRQWRQFLADWQEYLRTPDGRLIPFLILPGNHDIAPDFYELFFALFAFPHKELYRALDFGSYLSLILLDTGHFQPITGRQTLWLGKALADRTHLPYLFAIYHIGAYPAFYSYNGSTPKTIRTHWCPLFDQYRVQACFEHHGHAYKKTYPLKGNQRDPSGTLYFGDGCWGALPRRTHSAWYLDKRSKKNNIYLVELKHKSASINAIGLTGDLLEQSEIKPNN